MQLIRCTQKLQKEMSLKKASLHTEDPVSSLLGAWHANLLIFNRRKCVLFVNDKTLFNFIVPGLKKEGFSQLETVFRNILQCVLSEEGFDEQLRNLIMEEYKNIAFAATNNRSVMGSMNDLAFNYQVQIESHGGINTVRLPEIITQLNRMPMKTLGYGYPVDALRSLYGLQRES